jgi:hypothetical protein
MPHDSADRSRHASAVLLVFIQVRAAKNGRWARARNSAFNMEDGKLRSLAMPSLPKPLCLRAPSGTFSWNDREARTCLSAKGPQADIAGAG